MSDETAYIDRRIVELYDEDNPDGPDHDFYRALADEVGARSIVDLGCGTGILTVTFARPDRRVVGVDPSTAMIDYARARPGGRSVEWIDGDSRSIPSGLFDFAVMTGNVAQHIEDLDGALRDLHAGLRPGGTLAFESRNPAARAWEAWQSTERSTRETAHGTLIEWMDAAATAPGVVEIAAHNLYTETGETVVERFSLHFRDRAEIEDRLDAAGFTVAAVYRDWQRTPFTGDGPLMVFVAEAR